MGHNINGVAINEHALAEFKKKNTARWEDCSNGWMCSKCYRTSTYDYYKCPHCGRTMTNGIMPFDSGDRYGIQLAENSAEPEVRK